MRDNSSMRVRMTPDAAPIVILVKPQLGENIGMAARAMHNCGFSRLRIVAPRDGWPNQAAIAASAGADDLLARAEIFSDAQTAVADCHYLLAFTARKRDRQLPRYSLEQAVAQVMIQEKCQQNIGVLFGPENSGLDNDALCLADAAVHIALNPDFQSLNLSQAVLLFAYHYHSCGDTSALVPHPDNDPQHWGAPADRQALLNFFIRLESALDRRDFFKSAEKKPEMIRNMRSFFTRAAPSQKELQSLHGIMEKLQKTIGQ